MKLRDNSRVAIIGAGISGLTVANQLTQNSDNSRKVDIQIFEKSRGYGGRVTTRYATKNDITYHFDHGAQFFTAKSPEFQKFVAELHAANIVARWDAKFIELDGGDVTGEWQWGEEYPHFVATPKMNSLGKHLAKDLNVNLQCRITKMQKEADKWQLLDEEQNIYSDFDLVVFAIPAEQALQLLPEGFSGTGLVRNTKMQGCYTLMLGYEQPLELEWQAALVKNADISWISVNSAKPGRPEGYALSVHSTNKWAEEHIEDNKESVIQHLLAEVARVSGDNNISNAVHIDLHRWRYANIGKQQGERAILDRELGVAICGDWLIQGRIEAAYLSGKYLAEQIFASWN